MLCKAVRSSGSFSLVAPPSSGASFVWFTMAYKPMLIPDSGKEKGHKAKMHTSLLLTSLWPELR